MTDHGLTKGTPELDSVGPITFGPDSVLFIADNLGCRIVAVDVADNDVAEGDTIEAGKPFGTVESVKTLADLFAPIAGTVVRVNKANLEERPELVNDDCYGAAWMVAIAPTDPACLEGLLDPEAYALLLDGAH